MRFIIIFLFPIFCSGQVVFCEPDTLGTHAVRVRQAFTTELAKWMVDTPFMHHYPNFYPLENFLPDIISNHSYNMSTYGAIVLNYAKGICTVSAHWANTRTQKHWNINECSVRTGACNAAGENNNTSYGYGMDFVAQTDNLPFSTGYAQSYSTPIVAAQLYAIKHRRDSICECDTDWWEVYEAARNTAEHAGDWNQFRGYSRINVPAASMWSGTVGANVWATYNLESYVDAYVLDSFPRRSNLIGTELLKTYREEFDGNVEYTVNDIKSYVLKNHRSGVQTATTDGSGDITITFSSALPDNTYSLIVTPKGITYYTTTYHTEATGSVKVRFFDASGAAVTATSVTISYEAKDY